MSRPSMLNFRASIRLFDSRPIPEIDHALAVDTVPPGPELLRRLGRAEFVRVDLRNPLIAKAICTAKGYVRGFARRHDDVDVTVLRFANIIGSRVDTVLSRYFSRWTTSQAFDDFARGAALRRTVDPKWVATAERGVLSLAGRFR